MARAPRDRWMAVQEIYDLVALEIELDDRDREPIDKNAKSTRWHRTVRNALQQRKASAEIEYKRGRGFRIPRSVAQ